MTRAGVGVAIGLAIALAASRVASAGDPTRAYRTVETEHFVIYYWAPNDDIARRVGIVAERAHRTLSTAIDHLPDTKTIIVINDDTDAANGFAGVLPRNAIQLYATGPTGFTELDDHEDWYYGLVAHEYTHILHLDTMSGLPKIYNGIFGKTWAPNQIMPRWLIEGIAVYEESKRSAGGRIRGTMFDGVIRIARHANKDLRLDEVSGDPRQYPRGNAAYVYGSHFLGYVFDRFGDDTLRKMAHVSGSYAPPFAVNRQIAKVVGKPFTELYDDWKLFLRDKYGMQEMASERRGLITGRPLTHTAETNAVPRYSADGREIYWQQYDGYSLAQVRAMPIDGDQKGSREVIQLDAMGKYDLEPDGSIVYEQGRVYRRDYSFQDLFRWDAPTNQTVRLTTGMRARDPALSPDGRRVAFSKNERGESVIAVMDVEPGAPASVVWRGQRYDQAYQPAWSPDGTRIAFAAWRNGGLHDILVVEVASGHVEEITHDRAIEMSPAWSHDGHTLYFDSDRTGIANIYAYDFRDHSMWQVTNVLGGAFRCAISVDDKRLAYEAAVPNGGYDLYQVPIDRTTWLPARDYVDAKPTALEIRDDESPVTKPRPYRALETLAPPTWSGSYDVGSNTASIQTSGADAVGLHNYSLAVGIDTQRGDTDVGASYGYTGWRPTFRVSGARTLTERTGLKIDGVSMPFHEEDWSGTISFGIPFEQRPSSSWSLSFDYDLDWFRFVEGPPIMLDPNQRLPTSPRTNYVLGGLGSRAGFSNVRGNIFGTGPITGFDVSASIRLDHPALGSAYRDITLSYGFDVYQRLWGRTPTLAISALGALRAGDLDNPGGFGLGGVPAQDIAMAIVNSTRAAATGYLHGYPSRAIVGNQYDMANIEYRQELFQIEHGIATLPVYFRRVQLALQTDLATAYDDEADAGKNFRVSVGGALRLDAFFGYFVPGTFELGYAHGLMKGGIDETWLLLTGSL